MKKPIKGRGDIAKRVISFAEELGFTATLAKNGHLRFSREDTRTVFFSGTPGDHRAYQNALTKLRHAAAGTGNQSFG